MLKKRSRSCPDIQEEYAKRLEKAKDINTTQLNRENQSLKRIRKFVIDEFIDKCSAKAIARGIALQALEKDLDDLIDREFDEDTRNNFKLAVFFKIVDTFLSFKQPVFHPA